MSRAGGELRFEASGHRINVATLLVLFLVQPRLGALFPRASEGALRAFVVCAPGPAGRRQVLKLAVLPRERRLGLLQPVRQLFDDRPLREDVSLETTDLPREAPTALLRPFAEPLFRAELKRTLPD